MDLEMEADKKRKKKKKNDKPKKQHKTAPIKERKKNLKYINIICKKLFKMVMNGERDGYKWKHTCRHKMSKGERKQGMSLKTKTNTNTKSRCQNKFDFSLCNFG